MKNTRVVIASPQKHVSLVVLLYASLAMSRKTLDSVVVLNIQSRNTLKK